MRSLQCDLSILIPSLHNRSASREELLKALARQPFKYMSRCQVLVDIDGRQVTIGAKRNRLLAAAIGRYVTFIDDDDLVTPDYLERVFEGIDKGVDHVGVGMMFTPDHGRHHLVECSMHHEWGMREDGVYLRSPQHTCVVKRELALAVGFENSSFGEDRDYAERLRPLIETEHVITRPIYFYIYRRDK